MANAELRWLKGELTGTCVGKPTRKRGGSGLARWYKLQLVDAVIGNWEPVAGPPGAAPDGPAPFNQGTLTEVRLRSRTPGGTDEALSLREVSVWNWKMRDQREAGGESRCTLHGTVYAQVVDGTRRPVLADGADRLDGWGCLAVLAGLLVASWLWWSCGPFTCGLWGSVVLTSWWTHRMRTRRRTPPALVGKIVQGILGLLLLLGGVGLVLGLSDPARANSCSDVGGLAVLLAVGGVVGVSLLAVSWPLPWIWTLWTIVMVLWCGRAGSDCAGLWLTRGVDLVRSAAPREGRMPGEFLRRLTRGSETGPGEAGGSGNGSGGTGGAPNGSGATGSGGTGSGATGRGGSRNAGTDGGAPGSGENGGDGNSSGGTGAAANGSGGAGDGGTGSGGTGSGGTVHAAEKGEPGEDFPSASTEPRMSIESALNDPKGFLDGSTRITLAGDLLFEFDEDRLKSEAEPKLRQVAQLLREHPRTRVLLEGHADTIGGDQYNQELSERRAEAVRTWLVEHASINPSQMDTVGYGSSQPLVPASRGPAAQRVNRRVELRVLSGGP